MRHNLILVTHNVKDFADYPLELLDPWELSPE
jgi:predicted nucleic acid-binding protein